MSIMNKNYNIKFNNKDVNYTNIYINGIEKKLKIKLLTDSNKNSIQLHINETTESYQKITVLNINIYN